MKKIEDVKRYDNVFADLTDLLSYCTHSRTFTGIQRVTVEITKVLLTEGAHALSFDNTAALWVQVDHNLVLQLYSAMESSSINGPAVDAEIKNLQNELDLRQKPRFTRDSIVISFGANWSSNRFFGSIRAIKRQTPLVYACFVHDVVPLKLPELCDQETVSRYRRWIACALLNTDIIVTSSKINANEIARFSQSLDIPAINPILCGLGAVVRKQEILDMPSHDPWFKRYIKRNFVLFVGTIEPRKDHLFVLSAWKYIIETLGAEQTPLLVLVGKLGWRYEPVLWALEGHELHGRVVLMSDVSDHQLDELYDNTLFTIYNSVYEGWGLPVSESLSRSKVPLIPAHSGLLESGAKGAVFFEPGSKTDFVAKAIRLIRDHDFRNEKTRSLVAQCEVRKWSDVARRLFADIAHRIAGPERPVGAVIFVDTIYKFTDNINLQDLSKFGQSEALLESGWYYLENWGAWSSANDVTIAGRLKESGLPNVQKSATFSKQHEFLITIALLNVYDHRNISVFQDGFGSTLDIELPLGRTVIQIPVSFDENLRFRLALRQSSLTNLAEHTENWDRREIGFGIEAIMVCRSSNIQARIDFLEFHAGYRKSH